MERKQAGMAAWAIVFVVFAAIASTLWAVSEMSGQERRSMASAPQANVPVDVIRVNGSQPLVPLRSLWISGEVIELPEAAGAPTVTVHVGGQAYPAIVEGLSYSLELGHPPLGAMVVIEARAPHIQYRSVVGSVQWLRALAGADARIDVVEHGALSVSPFTTALESAVRFALGGRDALNDAEFAEGVRAGTNAELELTAYVLLNAAHYPEDLPTPFQTGYELLQDRAAYKAFTSYPWVKQYGSAYLFRQEQGGVPVQSISELPERLVLQDGLPYGDIATRVNRVVMLNRLQDGTFELHTNAAWHKPRFEATLGERGIVNLRPIERVWQGFVDTQYPVQAERSVYGYSLRRMAVSHGGVEVWAFAAQYRLPPGPFGSFRSTEEYHVFAGSSLDAWSETGAWASASGQVLPLPWFCVAATQENPLQHVESCDYVQHRLVAGAGQTLEQGWRMDPTTLAPAVTSGSQPFAWSVGTSGALELTTSTVQTQVWRLRTQVPGGATADAPTNILHLTRSLEPSTAGQTRVGIGMTASRRIESVGVDRAGDVWEHSQARAERRLYSGREGVVTRVSRNANGTGTRLTTREGVTEVQSEGFWQVVSSAIYDGRGVGYMPNNSTQPYRTCALATTAGAVACATQYTAFRPILTHNNRVYGIESAYHTPMSLVGGVRVAQPLERSSIAMTFYDCIAGNCPVNTVTAAALPPLLLQVPVAPSPVEIPPRAPRISGAHSRIPRLMPIYAFECTQCGHSFDRLQKLSDPDPDTCPACSAQAVKRQLTAPSFRLAGSGWYETDFKKDGDKKRNLADGGEGAKPSGESKPATDTTSAPKSEAPKAETKPSAAKPAAE
jgi:putative FmdB family regulatory protein